MSALVFYFINPGIKLVSIDENMDGVPAYTAKAFVAA